MARIRIEDLSPDHGNKLSDDELSGVAGGAIPIPRAVDLFGRAAGGLSGPKTRPGILLGKDPGRVAAAAWSVGCCNG